MNTETKIVMNEIDIQADRLLEISMQTEGAAGDILQRYAKRLMDLSAETYRALRKVEPVVFPLEHPPLRSLTEVDEESLSRR